MKTLKIAQLTTLIGGMAIMTISMVQALTLKVGSPMVQNYAILMVFGSLVVGFSLISIQSNKK